MVPIVVRLDSGRPIINVPLFSRYMTEDVIYVVPEKFLYAFTITFLLRSSWVSYDSCFPGQNGFSTRGERGERGGGSPGIGTHRIRQSTCILPSSCHAVSGSAFLPPIEKKWNEVGDSGRS